MKRLKYLLVIITMFFISGCTDVVKESNSNIVVTSYPIEYITKTLYFKNNAKENEDKYYGEIKSLYPDDMDNDFVVSDKLLEDYSNNGLFIFNGNEKKEPEYVAKMFQTNKDLKIIDASSSLTYHYGIEELWLDPTNLLTMANNIKKGFIEYTDNKAIIEDINKNYTVLKQNLISIDADYREAASRANNKTIIVNDDAFEYLTKYGLTVISLADDETLENKTIYNAETLLRNKTITHVYIKKGTELNKNLTELKNKYNFTVVELNGLQTITDNERKEGKDYISLINENLSALKLELYK